VHDFSAFDPLVWRRFSWLPPELKEREGASVIESRLTNAKRLTNLITQPIFQNPEHPNPIYIANAFLSTWSRIYFDSRTGQIVNHTELEGDRTVLLESATNGRPIAFYPSHREHEQIFVGDDPEKILEAALHDREWTKGSERGPVAFEDRMKRRFLLNSLKYELVSRLSRPGTDGEFVVTLSGNVQLADADLSHIVVKVIDSDGGAQPVFARTDKSESVRAGIVRTIVFPYVAPTGIGAHKITLDFPGMATFDEFILVMETQ
jgi:hypothetical protein